MTNREKLKRLVIEAIHELPYDEAIKKEFWTRGCVFIFEGEKYIVNCWGDDVRDTNPGNQGHCQDMRTDLYAELEELQFDIEEYKDQLLVLSTGWTGDNYPDNKSVSIAEKVDKVIGLPITLGRVMAALGLKLKGDYIVEGGEIEFYEYGPPWCWQLTHRDGSECTDDNQSDRTIERLVKLFEGEKEHD